MADKKENLIMNKFHINPDNTETIFKAGKSGVDLYKNSAGKIVSGIKGNKSIIGKASKNTCEFPVFVSNSVPLDYATATCTLLEQLYASYLQMAISMNPVVDERDTRGGGYLSNFITNTTSYVEYTDMEYAHDACHNEIETEEGIFEFNMLSIEDDDARYINEMCSYEPLSEFDHFFTEAKKEPVYEPISWEDWQKAFPASGNANKAQVNDEYIQYRKNVEELRKLLHENKPGQTKKENEERQARIDKLNAEIKKINAEINDADLSTEHGREIHNKRRQLAANAAIAEKDYKNYDARYALEKNRYNRDMMARAPEMMDETKIRKLNTMKPLMMKVQIRVKDTNGISEYPIELICGVKVHCRLVQSETLPEVVKFPLKEQNPLTRKVKYQAGELKFFKDFLFNIKEKKQTAIDSRDPAKKWYRRLYSLAHQKGDSFVSKFISGNARTGLMPNASIVMSQSDVENVKSQTDIDLMNGGTACKLCKEMFLMALVVIDQDRESVKILTPDIHGDYEVHSIAAINRQLAELDTSGTKTRDIFKLLG